jgi:hypothetical protein
MSLNLLTKSPLPNNPPKVLIPVIKKLKESRSKEECLKAAYKILTSKYHGHRYLTYLRLFDLFEDDIEVIWSKSGFLHCTILDYLLRLFLVKSGFYKDSEIKHHWTMIWYISPHQFTEVKLSKKKSIFVDIWGKNNGIKYGDYAHGFH